MEFLPVEYVAERQGGDYKLESMVELQFAYSSSAVVKVWDCIPVASSTAGKSSK